MVNHGMVVVNHPEKVRRWERWLISTVELWPACSDHALLLVRYQSFTSWLLKIIAYKKWQRLIAFISAFVLFLVVGVSLQQFHRHQHQPLRQGKMTEWVNAVVIIIIIVIIIIVTIIIIDMIVWSYFIKQFSVWWFPGKRCNWSTSKWMGFQG